MWQFEETIEGISETCEMLKIAVVSGNVSFYNDTEKTPIYPSPSIGMVGIIDDNDPLPASAFYHTALELGLVGPREGGSAAASSSPIGSSATVASLTIPICKC